MSRKQGRAKSGMVGILDFTFRQQRSKNKRAWFASVFRALCPYRLHASGACYDPIMGIGGFRDFVFFTHLDYVQRDDDGGARAFAGSRVDVQRAIKQGGTLL